MGRLPAARERRLSLPLIKKPSVIRPRSWSDPTGDPAMEALAEANHSNEDVEVSIKCYTSNLANMKKATMIKYLKGLAENARIDKRQILVFGFQEGRYTHKNVTCCKANTGNSYEFIKNELTAHLKTELGQQLYTFKDGNKSRRGFFKKGLFLLVFQKNDTLDTIKITVPPKAKGKDRRFWKRWI